MKKSKKAKLVITEKQYTKKECQLTCPHCHTEFHYMNGFDENILLYKCTQCGNSIRLYD